MSEEGTFNQVNKSLSRCWTIEKKGREWGRRSLNFIEDGRPMIWKGSIKENNLILNEQQNRRDRVFRCNLQQLTTTGKIAISQLSTPWVLVFSGGMPFLTPTN